MRQRRQTGAAPAKEAPKGREEAGDATCVRVAIGRDDVKQDGIGGGGPEGQGRSWQHCWLTGLVSVAALPKTLDRKIDLALSCPCFASSQSGPDRSFSCRSDGCGSRCVMRDYTTAPGMEMGLSSEPTNDVARMRFTG